MKTEIKEFIKEELELSINKDEVNDFKEKLETETDFYIEIDGNEYRIIEECVIWDTYVDTIKEIVEDCYDVNLPHFVAVDWEETAENCIVDGYGHTFSSYDGSEFEYEFDNINYYIFRTN